MRVAGCDGLCSSSERSGVTARVLPVLLEYDVEREIRKDSTFSTGLSRGRPRVSKASGWLTGWLTSTTRFDKGKLESSTDIDENHVRLLALFREESDDSSRTGGTGSGGLSAVAVVLCKVALTLTSSIDFDTTGTIHSAGKPETSISSRGADATDWTSPGVGTASFGRKDFLAASDQIPPRCSYNALSKNEISSI